MSWYGCLRFLQKSLVPILWYHVYERNDRNMKVYYIMSFHEWIYLCSVTIWDMEVWYWNYWKEYLGKKKMKTSMETLHHTSMHGCCKTGLCWAEESCPEYEKVWGYGQTALRLGQYDWLNQIMTIMQFETNPSPTQDSNTACCAAMHYPL